MCTRVAVCFSSRMVQGSRENNLSMAWMGAPREALAMCNAGSRRTHPSRKGRRQGQALFLLSPWENCVVGTEKHQILV